MEKDAKVEMATEEEYENLATDEPIPGVFFSVFIRYNMTHPTVKKKIVDDFIESDPLPTYAIANATSFRTAESIRKIFRGSIIKEVPQEELEDEYSIYVFDSKERPIAKLGVVAEDYRGKTTH